VRSFPRPRLFVSRCLCRAPCRWNGDTARSEVVEALLPHVDLVTTCPELELGLGVPREPLRIVKSGEHLELRQASGSDHTDAMQRFSERFLAGLPEIDGFVLKSRSPSCGWKEVKVYPGLGRGAPIERGTGLFAAAVLQRFEHLPIEDEGRLTNLRLREHFFTRLFVSAGLRQLPASFEALTRFHEDHRFLLSAYDSPGLATLDPWLDQQKHRPHEALRAEYALQLAKLLEHLPALASIAAGLRALYGRVEPALGQAERALFEELLATYRLRRLPLSACLSVLRAWAVRTDDASLLSQTIFRPFPEDLLSLSDSGRGRLA